MAGFVRYWIQSICVRGRYWVWKTLSCIINICSGRENFIISGERPWIYLCTSVNNEFILIYQQRILRYLENHSCSFSIINAGITRESYSFFALSPGSRTSKPTSGSWKGILYKHWLLVHAILETKIWRFYLEHVPLGLPFYILY